MNDTDRDKTNIAFKCTYNDGGKSKTSYGYKNVCTDAVIEYNIKKVKAEWCSYKECKCKQYYSKQISRAELDKYYLETGSVCYESHFFNDWTASAGVNHKGAKSGDGRSIKNADIGSLAVMTTVLPNMPEIDRRIFAVFLIDDYEIGNSDDEGYVASLSKYRIELTPQETNDLKFWDYYSNENSDDCRWGSGLFRYISDIQSAQVLKKLVVIKNGTSDAELSRELFVKFCLDKNLDLSQIGEPSGTRTRLW